MQQNNGIKGNGKKPPRLMSRVRWEVKDETINYSYFDVNHFSTDGCS